MSDEVYTLRMQRHMAKYVKERNAAHKHIFVFRGGRRSGKSYFIAQYLLSIVRREFGMPFEQLSRPSCMGSRPGIA